MKRSIAIALAIVLSFGQAAFSQEKKPLVKLTEEVIETAIKKGIDYLLSKQKDDGSWDSFVPKVDNPKNPHNDDRYICGTTSLICYAFLDSGMSIDDPQFKKALEFLLKDAEKPLPKQQALKDIVLEKDIMTYTLGLRCNVWLGVLKQLPKSPKEMTDEQKKNAAELQALRARVLKSFRGDVDRLVDTAYFKKGALGYATVSLKLKGPRPPFKEIEKNPPQVDIPLQAPNEPASFDNSNSQYGVLGVWAGLRSGEMPEDIPGEFWQICMEHWMKSQWKDGHWNGVEAEKDESRYYSDRAMTTAGIASMFICFEEVSAKKFSTCQGLKSPEWECIQKGLNWMDKNFKKSLTEGDPRDRFFYFIYGVERVGLASGYKYFGDADWFKEGMKIVLGWQDEDGAFREAKLGADNPEINALVGTGYALLFMIKGRRPVMLNKLEFGDDWCNRPRDLANLSRWMGKAFEMENNWQIVTLKSNPDEWHDARVLYMASNKEATFTDADAAKIKRYIQQGGSVLSVTECNGVAFTKSMRDLAAKMFPKYEFVKCDKDHPVYNLNFKIASDMNIYELTNGVRPLMILCETDLGKDWQEYSTTLGKKSFELAGNLVSYLTSRKFKGRGVGDWPAAPETPSTNKIKIAMLPGCPNANPEPLAWEKFGRLMEEKYKVGIEMLPKADDAAAAPAAAAPAGEATSAPTSAPASKFDSLLTPEVKFAVVYGTGKVNIEPADAETLKKWVDAGGTVLFEAGGGNEKFADSAREFIDKTWGAGSLTRLSSANELYTYKGMTIEKIKFLKAAKSRLGGAKDPQIEAVVKDGKPKVLFSREDITSGLLGVFFFTCDGYEPETSFDLMRNIVLYATGS